MEPRIGVNEKLVRTWTFQINDAWKSLIIREICLLIVVDKSQIDIVIHLRWYSAQISREILMESMILSAEKNSFNNLTWRDILDRTSKFISDRE